MCACVGGAFVIQLVPVCSSQAKRHKRTHISSYTWPSTVHYAPMFPNSFLLTTYSSTTLTPWLTPCRYCTFCMSVPLLWLSHADKMLPRVCQKTELTQEHKELPSLITLSFTGPCNGHLVAPRHPSLGWCVLIRRRVTSL